MIKAEPISANALKLAPQGKLTAADFRALAPRVDAMIERFRSRAAAVRRRGIPPIEGAERRRFVEQSELDYMDFAMLGDAEATLEDGILTLRVDLRPTPEPGRPGAPPT